ncbi:MAG TPA: DUF1264 domain-containing protein [Acidimicrobiales bacterium]|nr:DUF1264 domain-containing protein [Acidimicrobiales bacterium]
MAVRALMSEPPWPTSARAGSDESERGPIATAIRSKAPIAEERQCPQSFADAHLRWSPSGYGRVADHDREPLNDQVSHRLLYDGPGPDARLIGVEYLVSDEVYRRMPAEERLYWHAHECEDDDGLLTRPTRSRSEESAARAEARNLWAKVYRTWVSGGDYPRGPTRPFWSDTGELPLVLPPGAEAQLDIQ